MYRRSRPAMSSAEYLVGCFMYVFLLVGVPSIIGGFVFPYSINFWLEVMGKEPSMRFYHGMLIGLVPTVGYWGILLMVFTFVCSFFI